MKAVSEEMSMARCQYGSPNGEVEIELSEAQLGNNNKEGVGLNRAGLRRAE